MYRSVFKLFVIYFVLVLVVGCNQKTSKDDLLTTLQASSELSTSEFIFSKIISAKRTQSVFGIQLGPDAVFMAEVEATVKVGVDIATLTKKNIYYEGDTLVLQLPAPKILHFSMPPDKIKPLNDLSREYVFNKFSASDKDHFYRQAETELRERMLEYNFITKSKIHTISVFSMLLKQLGFSVSRIEVIEQE